MYSAVLDQLPLCHAGNQRVAFSADLLRQSAVTFLEQNPQFIDRSVFCNISANEDWNTYLNRHRKNGQWGDEIMFRAVSECFSVSVTVYHDDGNVTKLCPTKRIESELNLGLVSEQHYVSMRHVTNGATSTEMAATDAISESVDDDADKDIEDEHAPPDNPTDTEKLMPRRKRACNPLRAKAGSATYKSIFDAEWSKTWPFISKGQHPSYFWCSTCRVEISCSHQGRRDVERHVSSASHKVKTKDINSSQSMQNFVRSAGSNVISSLEHKARRAEVKMTAAMVHHNIPIAFADHLSPLMSEMFPDSEIAKKYSSARTKTSCILNGALKPHFQSELIKQMQFNPYSLSIDGSNDTGLEKMNPLTVKIFDVNRNEVVHKFLDMCTTSGKDCGTAKGIFAKMDEVLVRNEVPWMNCIALSVDNTSVNLGVRNSLQVHSTNKHKGIYVLGCPCHIVHNNAAKAGKAFANIGFDIQDLCVDTFYWFEYSTKRKAGLGDFCNFCDTEYRHVVKFCSTRWLSLESAVTRLLRLYQALKSYFLSESASQPRFHRLKRAFEDPMTEIYLLFFQSILPVFTRINLLFQRSDPCIHLIHSQIRTYLKSLLNKFLLPSVLADTPDITNVAYTEENQLSDDKLYVGLLTRMTLTRLLEDGSVSPTAASKFYASARIFFKTAVDYALSHVPFDDPVLTNAQFVNVSTRLESDFTQVQFFVQRYPTLLPYVSPAEQKLCDEFTEYQTMNDISIPHHVLQEAQISEEDSSGATIRYSRVDKLWGYLSTCKDATGMLTFERIAKVARLVLCLPHSNADEERVFSLVKHNKTPSRNSLLLDGTLSSILTVKMNSVEPCFKFEPTNAVILKSKTATWEYNQAHQ